MIKRLRKRFIWIALSVVATVIIVIVAGIDVANYLDMTSDADRIIAFMETETAVAPEGEPNGAFPPMKEPRDGAPRDRGPQGGDLPQGIPLETAFSARYFAVTTDEAGKIEDFDLDNIAMVSETELSDYIGKASGESGFVGSYRYHRTKTANGYRYFFLDCEKEIEACRTFIISSVIITSIGLAVIALFVILLSKKALEPVEESYRKQKRFITDAGHELKTPLTVISANAELLELDVGEDNEWLQSIKGQVQKLSKLTKELVFLSRVDEAEGAIDKATFSLKNALEDCIGEFKEAALVKEKEITLSAEDIPCFGNEEMIRRAICLLLDNAIKYAEGREISFLIRKEGKWVILEERNAATLPKGEHPELFERFYRGDASHSDLIAGHGVGLSVVKAIVEAHGGEASCLSDGADVTFRLTFSQNK